MTPLPLGVEVILWGVSLLALLVIFVLATRKRCALCGHWDSQHRTSTATCTSPYVKNAAGVQVKSPCPCPGWLPEPRKGYTPPRTGGPR